MSIDSHYSQFCPVAMTAEIFCQRWTVLVLREMFCGSTRFNDLRRGVPRMSPSLLSKRLIELKEAGVIVELPSSKSSGTDYHLTAAGEQLRPIVMAMGHWGQQWIESRLSLKNLDASLLMWDMRRWLDPKPLPRHRVVINFHYADAKKGNQTFWLVVDPEGDVDLCSTDPGFEVDLFVASPLRSMTAIWMGLTTVNQEVDNGNLVIDGSRDLASTMQTWLGLSPFARVKNQIAA